MGFLCFVRIEKVTIRCCLPRDSECKDAFVKGMNFDIPNRALDGTDSIVATILVNDVNMEGGVCRFGSVPICEVVNFTNFHTRDTVVARS